MLMFIYLPIFHTKMSVSLPSKLEVYLLSFLCPPPNSYSYSLIFLSLFAIFSSTHHLLHLQVQLGVAWSIFQVKVTLVEPNLQQDTLMILHIFSMLLTSFSSHHTIFPSCQLINLNLILSQCMI